MSKKLSTTELNAIADYITDTLYEEKKIEAEKKLNCISDEEYNTLKETVKTFADEVKTKCRDMEELINGKIYRRKKLAFYWATPAITSNAIYSSEIPGLPEYSDIRRKVMAKLVITNLTDAVDVDNLMSELRKTI